MILSPVKIGYAGIDTPTVIMALSDEGVMRRKGLFGIVGKDTLILKATDVTLPETDGTIIEIDFKEKGIKKNDRALASLGIVAQKENGLTMDMLQEALKLKFKKPVYDTAWATIEKVL